MFNYEVQRLSDFPCKLLLSHFSPTLCDPIDGSPPGSPVPGIFQAGTRVGCHFLLQYLKVKSESDVAQSCPTLSDLMDCSLPGSSVHGSALFLSLQFVILYQGDSDLFSASILK